MMKRVLSNLDARVFWTGLVIVAVIAGLMQITTQAPRQPNLLYCLLVGMAPQVMFLMPGIFIRTHDKKRLHHDYQAYFKGNIFMAVLLGVAGGLMIYVMIPKA